MFKFTIPTEENLYEELYNYDCVVKVVALSGGYDINTACDLLSKNKNMIASFSRALLENLNINQTEEEFNKELDSAITKIYNASVN
jgi:fructose-bisphosphate aldolase, class I